MEIIKLSQKEDRESWLDLRRGVITGTKVKGLGDKGEPVGVFEIVAEKLSITPDGEKPIDRGNRLEETSIRKTAEKLNLSVNFEPGMWLSEDKKIGVSPDASEDKKIPTFAIESKSLDSKNHLMAIYYDLITKDDDDYNPINSLKFGKNDFRKQVIQYFLVNEKLEKVYFSLYDDRQAIDSLVHYIITIERANVEEMLNNQDYRIKDVLNSIDIIINKLMEVE